MKITDYKKIKPLDNIFTLFDLKGKIGLITGGSGKLGQQFAQILSQAGAKIIIADIDKNTADNVARKIGRMVNKEIVGIGCDLTNQKQLHDLFKKIENKFHSLDFLINNILAKPEGYYQSFENYSLKTWDKTLQANLSGVFHCCQHAIPLLQKSDGSTIVNTASIYGIVGPDFRIYQDGPAKNNPYGGKMPLTLPAVYAASKGGLIALTKYLSTLLASKNIRVNSLIPGGVYDGHNEKFHSAYAHRTPLGRMAVWSDYNGAIIFLVSQASRYMTGTCLTIDGGWTAW